MHRSADGATRQSHDDQQPTHIDADARRVMALPTATLSDGAKLAWLHLWTWCGSRPKCRTLTIRDLTRLTGAERRTVWDRIHRLERAGLISVEDRERRQGQVTLHVYRVPDYDQPERPDPQQRLPLNLSAESTADLCIQDPASGSLPRGSLYTQSRPPSGDHTSCSRAHAGTYAVEDEVDVEDESTDEPWEGTDLDASVARRHTLARPLNALQRAAMEVTDEEAMLARETLNEVERKWKRARLGMAERQSQREMDQSMIRRTHVLLQRGIIPEWLFAEAVDRPIDHRRQGKPVHKPASQFTKILYQVPWFGKALGAVKEPLPVEEPQHAVEPRRSQPQRYIPPAPEEVAKSKAEARALLPRCELFTKASDQEPADTGEE